MVICLEWGTDLHMAQLMPLPLTISCFVKIQISFTFLIPAHPSSPGQRAVKLVCVCVCVNVCEKYFRSYFQIIETSLDLVSSAVNLYILWACIFRNSTVQMLLLCVALFCLVKLGPWSHTSERNEVSAWIVVINNHNVSSVCNVLLIYRELNTVRYQKQLICWIAITCCKLLPFCCNDFFSHFHL